MIFSFHASIYQQKLKNCFVLYSKQKVNLKASGLRNMQLEQVLEIEKQRVKAQENKIIQLQENLGFIQVQLESNFNSFNVVLLFLKFSLILDANLKYTKTVLRYHRFKIVALEEKDLNSMVIGKNQNANISIKKEL